MIDKEMKKSFWEYAPTWLLLRLSAFLIGLGFVIIPAIADALPKYLQGMFLKLMGGELKEKEVSK